VTGLLIAGYVERHTGQRLLKVIEVGEQLALGARVVGEVPDVPAPKWWKRARREAAQNPLKRRWWPRSERGDPQAPSVTILPYGSGWPVEEPLWQVWGDGR
jgi:hypothetical protein